MASITDALNEALRHHREGALGHAEVIYRRILDVAPAEGDALNLLAVLCLQTGRADEALDLASQATRANPAAAFHVTRADAAAALGRPALEAECLEQALALNPRAPQAAGWQRRRGRALSAAGDAPAAVRALRAAAALAPDDIDILDDLAVTLTRAGLTDEAEAAFTEVLRRRPGHAGATRNLVSLWLNQAASHLSVSQGSVSQGAAPVSGSHRATIAATLARRAVELDPGRREGWARLGLALMALNQPEPAADALRRALALPGAADETAEILINLGFLETRLGRFDAATAALDQAEAQEPGRAEVLNHRGVLLHAQGRLSAAAEVLARAAATAPDDHRPLTNLATVMKDLGDDDRAEALYLKALALAPGEPAVHWQRSLARLLAGDLATGWQEYEWRHQTGQMPPLDPGLTVLPEWPGPDSRAMAGTRLLVHAEQGHGDTLQFARYAALLAGAADRLGLARIGLMVQPALARLMALSLPGVTVVPPGAAVNAADWDARIPLMSLPHRLGTTLETIPAQCPYLTPPPVEGWGARLAQAVPPGMRAVGLVWGGDPRPDDPVSALIDRRRSVPLAVLAPLAAAGDVRFISLQKGAPAAQAATAPFPLLDWTGELQDFADTAALVACLDLVITVDTAVAHLAGALGRPVWVLSRTDGCWRWLRDRADSPWYPTLRLYRQECWGDWSATARQVANDLVATPIP
ncbi:tetratricopeptide repeat protein [Nitrospirillum sp. BR 11164]|uniref:tetratricopeptide repeat protein n=1 Tax=Nitrospirillum sp. BR 11164 TaxID=3104324 RepID=UPI002AFEF98A|nr:tetratricopeptide repeat protein [Nitrospirillum sp. BR 11164]MEA1653099.1 tetratricopeptide repeat protein [Nitrospirillum sp. BR 11164]